MIKLKILVIALLLVIVLSACSKPTQQNMSFSTGEKDITYTLKSTDDSQPVRISSESWSAVTDYIDSVKVDYVYSDLYETEEVMKRLDTDINIVKHRYSALDSSGQLTADSLYQCVIKNNEAFLDSLEPGTNKYEEIKAEDLMEICQLIVESVNTVLDKYPDIDRERVCCNLGNLKILYNIATLDFAHVTSEMVMNISENMLVAAEAIKGDAAARNTIIHETMHVIQIGCVCEEIPDCSRRCGVALYCEEFELNTTDFKWLPEASAERMMCNITGDEPTTYEFAVNYLCSLNLATMLQTEVPADYVETISFYDDINKIYELFHCKTEEECMEVLNMLISIDIIQQQPEPLMKAYGDKFGVDVEEDAVTAELFCKLKPSICLTLSKNFYRNLATLISEREDVTVNDMCYLIGLFEAVLDSHMKYSNENYDKYNVGFVDSYCRLRSEFFDAVQTEDGIDIESYYMEYSLEDLTTAETDVNAGLKWLDADKKEFLLERTGKVEFNLGAKVKYCEENR